MATGIEVKGFGALGATIATQVRSQPLFMNTRGRRNVSPGAALSPNCLDPLPHPRNAPFIPTCGNMLPCMDNSPIRAISGYGRGSGVGMGQGLGAIIGCGAINSTLTALRAAIGQADAGGLTSANSNYQAAQQFISDHTGLSTDFILIGSSCDAAVAQGNQILTALNADLQAGGGTPIPVPAAPPPSTGLPFFPDTGGVGIFDAVKWLAIGGAVIAGVVLLYPIVKEATVVHRLKRHG